MVRIWCAACGRYCDVQGDHFPVSSVPNPCLQADYKRGDGTRPSLLATIAGVGGAGGLGLGPSPGSPHVHRLRTIHARELALTGGAVLGAGSFGAVQVGVWNGTDVAIKANGVDCRDPLAIAREREMCACPVIDLCTMLVVNLVHPCQDGIGRVVLWQPSWAHCSQASSLFVFGCSLAFAWAVLSWS